LQPGKRHPDEISPYVHWLIKQRKIIDAGAFVPMDFYEDETWEILAWIRNLQEQIIYDNTFSGLKSASKNTIVTYDPTKGRR